MPRTNFWFKRWFGFNFISDFVYNKIEKHEPNAACTKVKICLAFNNNHPIERVFARLGEKIFSRSSEWYPIRGKCRTDLAASYLPNLSPAFFLMKLFASTFCNIGPSTIFIISHIKQEGWNIWRRRGKFAFSTWILARIGRKYLSKLLKDSYYSPIVLFILC